MDATTKLTPQSLLVPGEENAAELSRSGVLSGVLSPAQWFRWLLTKTIRLVVLVVGASVAGAGVAMLVLPGPGVLVIVFGLVILTTQFVWAERALERMTNIATSMARTASSDRRGRILLGLSGTAMVVGGGLVVFLLGEYRLAGTSVVVSGLIGLAALLPSVGRWIARRADPSLRTPPYNHPPALAHHNRLDVPNPPTKDVFS